MKIAGSKFLVIGGAGFIGSHLVDLLLSEGASLVRVYDNFSRGSIDNLSHLKTESRLEIFLGGADILHLDTLNDSMQGIDGVFHLASLWLLHCEQYPRSAFNVNVLGTMNVVEMALKNNIKRFVFSSSASVYGNALYEPIDEAHPFHTLDFYGSTKVCSEYLIRSLYAKHNSENDHQLCFTGLRYMNVYGPRQDDKGAYVGVIPRVLNSLDSASSPIIFGDGSQSYDFVDVRDCAIANLKAMSSHSHNRFFNVGTGIKTSILDLVQILSSHYSDPPAPLFKSAPRSFVTTRVASTHDASKYLGFESKLSLSEGISNLVAWRAHVN